MAREKKKRKGLVITLSVLITVVLLLLGALLFVELSIKDLESTIKEEQVDVEEAFDARSVETKDFIKILNDKMKEIPEKLTKLESAIAKLEKAEETLEKASGVKAMSEASVKVDLAINNIIDTINNEYDFLKIALSETGIAEEIDTARHRIVISITNYNKVVDEYNSVIQNFPGDFIANIFGHEDKDTFQSYEYEDFVDLIS